MCLSALIYMCIYRFTRLGRGLYYRYHNGRNSSWVPPSTTIAHSSTHVIIPDPHGAPPTPIPLHQSPSLTSLTPPSLRSLPMLCSHCPGWVCFAEKTNPQCIPYMSTAKSAQQIIGSLLKLVLARDATLGSELSPATSIYHVSVQPCFDKKLEASRLVSDYYEMDRYVSMDTLSLYRYLYVHVYA